MKPELFTKDTTAIVYGYHVNAIQRMLDFDYACGRKVPSVAAIVNPGSEGGHKVFFGKGEVLLPMYKNFEAAAARHP
ncbi:MAG TPA: ATP citrate synthase, partial [Elusimicrobia bacterium]|nr:ATP citrate synthase [Elusimicrobiota bacterium]